MVINQLRSCLLLLLILALAQFCRAEAVFWTDLTLGADAYAYPQIKNAPEQPPQWALDQTAQLRFNLSTYPADHLEFGVHYGLSQRWRFAQDEGDTDFEGMVSGANYRWQDLDAQLYSSDNDSLVIEQNLDRLYGLWQTDQGDLSFGRQAISFGLSRQFSPVDVVLPAGIGAAERSYRPGVDAVRWLQPLGQMGELDLGWVFGEDQLAFVRTYNQLNQVALELTALTVNGDYQLLGVGTQSSLGSWGVWQELAWLASDESEGARLTLGVDQQVMGDVYLALEYHYNGLGASTNYREVIQQGFYQKGLVVPAGRHYASVLASKSLNPLLYAQGAVLVNLGDGGWLLNAGLDYSLNNNASLDLSISFPIAQSPVLTPEGLRINEEFGVYPARISVNWSTVF